MVTSGAQQAIDIIVRALLEPGDCVAVEEPGYPPPRLLMQSLGARVVPVRADSQGIVVADLPENARLVYVTPAHQFPLGMPMSLPRRMELLAWPASTMPPSSKTITTASSASAGVPAETLHALDSRPGPLRRHVLQDHAAGDPARFSRDPAAGPAGPAAGETSHGLALPAGDQAALARFIDEGLLARHIRKMRGEYKSRHERMLEVLAGQGDWLRPIESTAGTHLTALLPPARHLSAEDVLTRTDGSGVAVNSLSEFYAGHATQSGLVLGYGAVALDKIENGLQLLWRLLDCP